MQLPKKILTVATAAVLAANGILAGGILTSYADDSTRYEFEDGTFTGTQTENAAASGGSYIFFENTGQTATATVPVDSEGMYDVYIGYNAQYGDKIEYLIVDGINQGNVSMAGTAVDEIAEVKAGTVRLTAGDHQIGVECSWSWVNVDYVRIEPAVLPEVYATDASCSDPEATPETQKLMEFLSSVYGEHVISGQQEFYGESRDDEFNYIENLTGELPVIRGFDFGETCPLFSWDAGTTGRIISWVNDTGGIATASWHVNVPISMDSYTPGQTMAFDQTTYSEKTDFVTANVMVEGTKEYEFFEEAVANLAAELQKIQDAGVPLLFRPFHEAEGNGGADGAGAWFWWSKEGAEVYVELYQYLYNKLTQEYGLHNLIWEFNSYTYSDESAQFYPGRDYIDIIGYDKYNANSGVPNESAISSTFYSLISMYDNTKMIAMMENDTIPSVENMTAEGAYWLYFMPWYDQHLMSPQYNDPDTLTEIYQSELVITLDEFKEMYADFQPSGTTVSRPTTTTGETTARVTTTTATVPTITDGIAADIKKSGQNYVISFDQAIGDTVVLILDAASNVFFANGCVGISVNVGGTDYWVSYQWEYTGNDEVTVDLNTPFNITYNNGSDEVEDEALAAQIIAAAQEQTSGEVQMWWANDGEGEAVPPSNVTLIGAYIPLGTDVTTTEAEGTTTQEDTTTTEVETTTTEAVETTTNEEETTTEPVTEPSTVGTEETTTAIVETTTVTEPVQTTTEPGDPVSTLCGDVNLDGNVNMADVILLSKAAINIVDLSPTAEANGDCNADRTTDGNDANILLRFNVQLVDRLPYTE